MMLESRGTEIYLTLPQVRLDFKQIDPHCPPSQLFHEIRNSKSLGFRISS